MQSKSVSLIYTSSEMPGSLITQNGIYINYIRSNDNNVSILVFLFQLFLLEEYEKKHNHIGPNTIITFIYLMFLFFHVGYLLFFYPTVC